MRNIYIVVFILVVLIPKFAGAVECPAQVRISFGNLRLSNSESITEVADQDDLFKANFPRLLAEGEFLQKVDRFVKQVLQDLPETPMEITASSRERQGLCGYTGQVPAIGERLSADVYRRRSPHQQHKAGSLFKLQFVVPIDIRHISRAYENAPAFVDLYLYLKLHRISNSELLPASSENSTLTAFYGFHSNHSEPHIFEHEVAAGGGDAVEVEVAPHL